MTKLFQVMSVVLVFLGSVAMAAPIKTLSCKVATQAAGHGLELKVVGKKAKLTDKSVLLAAMTLESSNNAKCCDQISISTYSQKTVNGYSAKIESGGLTGAVKATVYRSGFAGQTVIAVLDDCR